jgi:hypothetical protein
MTKHKVPKYLKNLMALAAFGFLLICFTPATHVAAAPAPVEEPPQSTVYLGDPVGKYKCGGGDQAVETSINIGCKGKGNPILDATFAIIRVLSIGVGLAVVAGLIIAGIQLSASQGDPQRRAKAIARIYNVVIALFVYIFAYAILNYVIPAGFFK